MDSGSVQSHGPYHHRKARKKKAEKYIHALAEFEDKAPVFECSMITRVLDRAAAGTSVTLNWNTNLSVLCTNKIFLQEVI